VDIQGLSQEGRNDEDIQAQGHGEQEINQDISYLGGPMTRGRLRKPARDIATQGG